MQLFRSGTASALTLVLVAVGCGGGSDGGGTTAPPPAPVLTTLAVTAASATLFTVAPGNSTGLAVVARDQNGAVISNAGTVTYSSGNPSVATIGSDGVVRATGAGTAQINASVTFGGITRGGGTNVTVQVAPASGTVTAPEFVFLPTTIDVQAGGVVTWSIGAIHHNVTFNSAGAPANIDELRNASDSRTFPSSGTFNYNCAFHAGMNGTVVVH